MLSLTVKAYAKINLTLDVLYKRSDGYHELETVVQSIDLYDILELTRTSGEITFSTDSADIPSGQRNLAWRAAALLKRESGCQYGAHIQLKKCVPVAAGLAGGSADAAAVLLGLNCIWELGLSRQRLAFIGGKIGSDVPFCIYGGAALARGRGERVTLLKTAPVLPVVLVKPAFGLSTAEVYRRFSESGHGKRVFGSVDTKRMVRAVESKDGLSIARLLANDLEPAAMEIKPEIFLIKKRLLSAGALGSLMSGSGPTVFGIFDSHEQAKRAAERLGGMSERLSLNTGMNTNLNLDVNVNADIFVTKTLEGPVDKQLRGF